MKTNHKILLLLPIIAMFLIAATGNVRWLQIRSGDRHGTGAYGQASDGTGASGNCAKFAADGSLTDFGAVCGSASSTNPAFLVGSSLGTSTGSGFSIPGTSLVVGTIYYQGSSGLVQSEANASTTVPAICLAVSTTSCEFSGVYRFSATQSWTVGGPVYVSDATLGGLTQTAPTTSGHFVQRFGIASAADTLLIMPSIDIAGIQ